MVEDVSVAKVILDSDLPDPKIFLLIDETANLDSKEEVVLEYLEKNKISSADFIRILDKFHGENCVDNGYSLSSKASIFYSFLNKNKISSADFTKILDKFQGKNCVILRNGLIKGFIREYIDCNSPNPAELILLIDKVSTLSHRVEIVLDYLKNNKLSSVDFIKILDKFQGEYGTYNLEELIREYIDCNSPNPAEFKIILSRVLGNEAKLKFIDILVKKQRLGIGWDLYLSSSLDDVVTGRYKELKSVLETTKIEDALTEDGLKQVLDYFSDGTEEVNDMIKNLPVISLVLFYKFRKNSIFPNNAFKYEFAKKMKESLSVDSDRFFEIPRELVVFQNLIGDINYPHKASTICDYVARNKIKYDDNDVATLNIKFSDEIDKKRLKEIAELSEKVLISANFTDDDLKQLIRRISNSDDLGIIESDPGNFSKIRDVFTNRSKDLVYLLNQGKIEDIAHALRSVQDGCVANVGTQLNAVINSVLIKDPAARVLHRIISDFMFPDVAKYYLDTPTSEEERVDILGGSVGGLDYLNSGYITENVIYPIALIEFLIAKLKNSEPGEIIEAYFVAKRFEITDGIYNLTGAQDMDAAQRIFAALVIISQSFPENEYYKIKEKYFDYLKTTRSQEVVTAVGESLAKYELYQEVSSSNNLPRMQLFVRNYFALNIRLEDVKSVVPSRRQEALVQKEYMSYLVQREGFRSNSKELSDMVSDALKLGLSKRDIVDTITIAQNCRDPKNVGAKFLFKFEVEKFVNRQEREIFGSISRH